jgi:dienelactone hydrolase
MTVERISYSAGGKTFVGALVYDERAAGKRPLLLMAPNWLGATGEAIERTKMLAGSRFIGFVADMYGDGKVSAGPPESAELADALRADPKERRRRISAALATLISESEKRGIGDATRKVAIGFCFGGGNVLELARSGADLTAAICLHGDLTTSLPAKAGDIKAPLLVAHGATDPAAPKAQRDAFEAEMEAAKAKWQMHTFGHVVHSFCEPEANVPGLAEYDEAAARQTYRMIEHFIADAFDGRL